MKNKFIKKIIDNFEETTTFQLKPECHLYLNIGKVFLQRFKTKDTDTLFVGIFNSNSEIYSSSPGFLYLEENSFLIRINNSENIQLGRPIIDRKSGQERSYDYNDSKFYNWYKEWYTYEITLEQLQKICEADTVAIKVNNQVYDDKNFQHLFLEHCQIFYNGTYDSTLYTDTVKKQYKKEKEEKLREEQEEQEALLAQKKEKQELLITLIKIAFIIIGFILFSLIMENI